MIRNILLVTTLLLLGCDNSDNGFTFGDISELYIADFVSDAPEQCQPSDVDLSAEEVKTFFQRAREVDHKTLHDHYNYAPCATEGTLRYKQQSCDWQVRAGATGYIQCGETKRYFACDSCDELFENGSDISIN